MDNRSLQSRYDAVVVGSGPNGMAAAITLARAGRSVLVIEARNTIGGGTRTQELTLPGFWHDVCSAIHPMGIASPFFKSLPMTELGVRWIHPSAPLSHPFDDGTAAVLERSVEATAERLGADAGAYIRLFRPLVDHYEELLEDILGPFPVPPRHPFLDLFFSLGAFRSAHGLAKSTFHTEAARVLFAGSATHAILPLDRAVSASYGLVLNLIAHAIGWPIPAGGSQSITAAMLRYLLSLGGEVVTGWEVHTIDELPPADQYLFDLTPLQLLKVAGRRLPESYRRRLLRYRYGPGAFKIDWALSEPVPWKSSECRRSGTVHLGGCLNEIVASERAVWAGRTPEKPFVLFVQPSLFDSTRAPEGRHTGWAYCHVPNGSTEDMTARIEAQVERFAPGFRDCILARNVIPASEMEDYNPNYIGGDINGGVQDLGQLFTRPVARLVPYSTPNPSIFLCSSSTPPGGAVHGMCGYHAARAALRAKKTIHE